MANIEQSIKVGNGFALKAPSPVDLKTTAATIAERDSYVSQGFGYPGILFMWKLMILIISIRVPLGLSF